MTRTVHAARSPLRHQVATRVDGRPVHAHLVVQVRARGASGGADRADRLATAYLLALADVELGEMTVERVEAAAVVDDDETTVASVATGEHDLAVAGGGDRMAVAGRDVDAGMHLPALSVGRLARPEWRGHEPANRPDARNATAQVVRPV